MINVWNFCSGTDRSRVARTSSDLHIFYEGNRAQGYGACDRSPLSAGCGTDTDLSGSHEFTDKSESMAPYRALYAAWQKGLAGNYLFEACTPGKCIPVEFHLKMSRVRGRVPLWLQIGPAWHNYVFKPLDYLPLWKGNAPAANSDVAAGGVLFLFKAAVFGGDGVWLCLHGPRVINSLDQFHAAARDRSLTPLWGSLDNVIAKGSHSWYTFDRNTWQWVSGCNRFETTVPDFSESESDD